MVIRAIMNQRSRHWVDLTCKLGHPLTEGKWGISHEKWWLHHVGDLTLYKLEVPTIYKAYCLGLCKGISPQDMARNMILTYLHLGSFFIPIELMG